MLARALHATLLAALASAALAAPARTTAVTDAYRPAPLQFLPQPRELKLASGNLGLDGLSIRLEGAAPELAWAARDINDELRVRLGRSLPVAQAASRVIRIGTLADGDLAARAAARGLSLPERSEAYALWVDPAGATVVGRDALGAYRGAQTLRQLLSAHGFRFATVRDWPELRVRMAMVYLDRFSPQVNDILIPLLARMKFSHLLAMANYVQWDSTKNIWHSNGATKAEARRVAELIRTHGMEPIPLIELMGHTQWLFVNGQNADLKQDPASTEGFAYDTLNPRTYEVVLPILSEAVEVFHPKYLHIGHDEVRHVDQFPARDNGKAVGFEKLFVDDVTRLHDHLAGLGVGTMIWQDTALAPASKDAILPALPKDIVMTDWHYSPGDDFPTIREIQAAGFQAIGASWYSPDNPESFAASAARDGALGMLQTRWTGYFGNPSILDGQAEQGVAYARAAASFWNPGAPASLAVAAASYHDGVRPSAYRPLPGQLVDLSAAVTRKLADPDESQWVQKGPDTDLAAVPTGTVRLGSTLYRVDGAVMTRGSRAAASDLPERVTVELNAKAAALSFLHTTGWTQPGDEPGDAPMPRVKVGQYVVTYADGSSIAVPLEYGRNITSWLASLPRTTRYEPAWRGQTRDGVEVGLNAFTWVNPTPEKRITAITLESAGGIANPALVALTLLDAVPQEAKQ